MLRHFVVVLLVLSFGETKRRHGHRHRCNTCEDDIPILFEAIAIDVVEANRKGQDFCKDHNAQVKEVYGPDSYQLIVPIRDYDDANIKVKIKYRVIYMKVDKKQERYRPTKTTKSKWRQPEEQEPLEVIKILPDIVDPKRATWNVKNVQLVIVIPYEAKPNEEVQRTCEEPIDDDVFDVPFNVTVNPDLDSMTGGNPDDNLSPENTTPMFDFSNKTNRY